MRKECLHFDTIEIQRKWMWDNVASPGLRWAGALHCLSRFIRSWGSGDEHGRLPRMHRAFLHLKQTRSFQWVDGVLQGEEWVQLLIAALSNLWIGCIVLAWGQLSEGAERGRWRDHVGVHHMESWARGEGASSPAIRHLKKGGKCAKWLIVTSRDWHMAKNATGERLGHSCNLNVHSFYKQKRCKMKKKNSEITTWDAVYQSWITVANERVGEALKKGQNRVPLTGTAARPHTGRHSIKNVSVIQPASTSRTTWPVPGICVISFTLSPWPTEADIVHFTRQVRRQGAELLVFSSPGLGPRFSDVQPTVLSTTRWPPNWLSCLNSHTHRNGFKSVHFTWRWEYISWNYRT